MNTMNGMPNMPNNMYNGFGGNMGMAGMNDMSPMNMYGGGYGNWGQGANGAGFGNFNGYGPMGGYNQQYPEMMNQFPKNNIPNQNRFHANGGAFPQQRNHRNGSFGGHGNQNQNQNHGAGPMFTPKANSRPESRSGAPQNVRRFHKVPPITLEHRPNTNNHAQLQRDSEVPEGKVEGASETKAKGEDAKPSAETAQEGKNNVDGAVDSTASPNAVEGDGGSKGVESLEQLTKPADNGSSNVPQAGGLNPIQTVDSIEMDHSTSYDQPMMVNAMQPNQYPQGMMNNYPNQMPMMNGSYDTNMGYHQNNFGPRGGFNTAYGAATVLVGEPRGLGVAGAPTGPRAMREGRPNTGFSSRMNNQRSVSNAPVASAPPAQEAAPNSPPRKSRA